MTKGAKDTKQIQTAAAEVVTPEDMILVFKKDGSVTPMGLALSADKVNAAIQRMTTAQFPSPSDTSLVNRFNAFMALAKAATNPQIMSVLTEWASGDEDNAEALVNSIIRPN